MPPSGGSGYLGYTLLQTVRSRAGGVLRHRRAFGQTLTLVSDQKLARRIAEAGKHQHEGGQPGSHVEFWPCTVRRSMTEYTLPTNDLLEMLVSKLTPECKDIAAEIDREGLTLSEERTPKEKAQEVPGAAVIGRLKALPACEYTLVTQVVGLQTRAHEALAEEALAEEDLQSASEAERAIIIIRCAVKLERAEGRRPREDVTLGEAIEIIERHCEGLPAGLCLGLR